MVQPKVEDEGHDELHVQPGLPEEEAVQIVEPRAVGEPVQEEQVHQEAPELHEEVRRPARQSGARQSGSRSHTLG